MKYTIQGKRSRLGLPIILGAVFLLVVAATIYYFVTRPTYTTFVAPNPGVHLRYSSKLEQIPLTKADKQDKFLLRLKDSTGKADKMLITVRYEDGLHALAIAKRNLRDMLLENASRIYPGRFPDYHELNRRSFTQHGHDAGELFFTYTGPNGQAIRQRFMVVTRNDDQAIYLSAQAQKNDFDRLNRAYFEDIATSLSP